MKITGVLIFALILAVLGLFYGTYLQMEERTKCHNSEGVVVGVQEICVSNKILKDYKL